MNLNDFARAVAKREGLKQELSIAQIKEVMRIVFTLLASMRPAQVAGILKRYSKKGGKSCRSSR